MATTDQRGDGRPRLLGGAVLVNVCLGSLFAWSLFVTPLADAFGASPAALSGVFSLAVATFAVVVLAAGGLVDRTPPGRIVVAAAGCVLCGMLLAGRASTLLWVAAGYGLLFGVGNGLGYATAVAVAGRGFRARRGLAVGLVVGAYATGPLVASPVISALLAAVGWRATFATLGAGLGGLLLCAAVLLRAGGGVATPAGRPAQHGTRLRPSRHPGGTIGAAFLLGTTPAMLVVSHAAAIATARGLDAAATTAAVALLGAGNLAGRTGGGWLSDRTGRVPGLATAAATLGLACLALPAVSGTVPILVAVVVIGAGYGTQSALVPSLTADLFGPRHFAANFGRVFLGWGVAGLLGPQIGARLGGTAAGFAVALRLGAVSAALALVLYLTIARAAAREHGDTAGRDGDVVSDHAGDHATGRTGTGGSGARGA